VCKSESTESPPTMRPLHTNLATRSSLGLAPSYRHLAKSEPRLDGRLNKKLVKRGSRKVLRVWEEHQALSGRFANCRRDADSTPASPEKCIGVFNHRVAYAAILSALLDSLKKSRHDLGWYYERREELARRIADEFKSPEAFADFGRDFQRALHRAPDSERLFLESRLANAEREIAKAAGAARLSKKQVELERARAQSRLRSAGVASRGVLAGIERSFAMAQRQAARAAWVPTKLINRPPPRWEAPPPISLRAPPMPHVPATAA
jgi:hypothetical protein